MEDLVAGFGGAEAEDFLEEVAVVGGVVAGVGGGGAVEEGGVVVVGAGGVGEQVGGLVEVDHLDAVGRGEVLGVGVLRELDGLLHEVGPDGRGGVAPSSLMSV